MASSLAVINRDHQFIWEPPNQLLQDKLDLKLTSFKLPFGTFKMHDKTSHKIV